MVLDNKLSCAHFPPKAVLSVKLSYLNQIAAWNRVIHWMEVCSGLNLTLSILEPFTWLKRKTQKCDGGSWFSVQCINYAQGLVNKCTQAIVTQGTNCIIKNIQQLGSSIAQSGVIRNLMMFLPMLGQPVFFWSLEPLPI